MHGLESEGLRDLVRREVVGDEPGVFQGLPLGVREVEDFRFADWQRDHESVRETAERRQQTALAEVDQG